MQVAHMVMRSAKEAISGKQVCINKWVEVYRRKQRMNLFKQNRYATWHMPR